MDTTDNSISTQEESTILCVKCNTDKPSTDFFPKRIYKDGIRGVCILCHKAYFSQYRADVRNNIREKRVVSEKRCQRCMIVFDVTNFHVCRESLDGFSGICKSCASKKVVARRAAYNSESREKQIVNEKHCSKCDTTFGVEMFWRDNGSFDGLDCWCKICRVTQKRNARHAGSQHSIVKKKRRRARKLCSPVVDFTAEQWEIVKLAFAYRCYYCGKKPKKLTQDHIIPLYENGNHSMENIVPACHSCNARKGNRKASIPVQMMLKLSVDKS
jgi:5-methylcytosine-specific restriction endonuclease McrA